MASRRFTFVILFAGVVPLATAGLMRALRSSVARVSAGDAGSAADTGTRIPGANLQERGDGSRCDEGPPSAESQAEWRLHASPRALAAVAMTDLARRGDKELVSELYARLLDERYGPTGLGGMTRVEQNLYLALTMHGEVMNGGFHQFFASSSGNCAMRTAAALAEIGDGVPTAIFRRALAKFPGAAPAEDRALRGEQLDALGDEHAAWQELDRAYYAAGLPDTVLARYGRAHGEGLTPPVPAARATTDQPR
jgi:hypothetical protein